MKAAAGPITANSTMTRPPLRVTVRLLCQPVLARRPAGATCKAALALRSQAAALATHNVPLCCCASCV